MIDRASLIVSNDADRHALVTLIDDVIDMGIPF